MKKITMLSKNDPFTWLKRPRILDFYESLVQTIPCYPDTYSTKQQLASMSLSDVLISYVNYADRFIAPRPRQVSWAKEFWLSAEAQAQMNSIFEIVREIEQGDDLQRRLSHRTLKVGFAPGAANKWEDKDFALNAYDVHHLHLGGLNKHGSFKHADPLLFLTVSRNHAHILLLGTHQSFGDRSIEKVVALERAHAGFTFKGLAGPRTSPNLDEKHRLARIGFSTSTEVENQVVPLAMLTSSGHRLRTVRYADQVLHVIQQVETLIDQPDFVANTFGSTAGRIAAEPDFVWRMQYLDLALIDMKSMTAGRFLPGAH